MRQQCSKGVGSSRAKKKRKRKDDDDGDDATLPFLAAILAKKTEIRNSALLKKGYDLTTPNHR